VSRWGRAVWQHQLKCTWLWTTQLDPIFPLSPKLDDYAELEEPMARKAKVKVRPASKVARKANRWHYETISISRTTEVVALNGTLNALGEQGWELVVAREERVSG
jgi:hypothetical protein